jgi:hypothetical protein
VRKPLHIFDLLHTYFMHIDLLLKKFFPWC